MKLGIWGEFPVYSRQLCMIFLWELPLFWRWITNNLLIELGGRLNTTEVTIINVFGQIIYNENFNNKSSINLKLENNPGIYFLNVKSGNESTTFKVIKL
ncbi:MAG: T9SS type A sorting domain-containing protein [Saprospiraceae bacterium]|nr:T9SS type A sorting domain-containing protein [Candidatus Defluviibacterium haderslevense]